MQAKQKAVKKNNNFRTQCKLTKEKINIKRTGYEDRMDHNGNKEEEGCLDSVPYFPMIQICDHLKTISKGTAGLSVQLYSPLAA
jgi:hypothetical protein